VCHSLQHNFVEGLTEQQACAFVVTDEDLKPELQCQLASKCCVAV
jgi:hypothetical protein